GGRLTDRVGPRFMLVIGVAVYIGVVVALALRLHPWAALAVFLVFGLVAGLTEPAERVVVGRLAPVKTGRGFGDFHGLAGLAALPAGLGFGVLYTARGGPAALLGSAVVLA